MGIPLRTALSPSCARDERLREHWPEERERRLCHRMRRTLSMLWTASGGLYESASSAATLAILSTSDFEYSIVSNAYPFASASWRFPK